VTAGATAAACQRLAVTVSCGAAQASAPYMTAARDLGRLLAERDIHVVYGGGRLGLIGAMADAAPAAGGHVTGILPTCLNWPASPTRNSPTSASSTT
jgi:predicted Rossmann-fold nucleotide-binding protein